MIRNGTKNLRNFEINWRKENNESRAKRNLKRNSISERSIQDACKNIPSKLKENTKNWITNEQAKNKPIQKNIALAKIRGKLRINPWLARSLINL